LFIVIEMSDISYPVLSEGLTGDRGDVDDQNVVPCAARDVLCGPPLPRDRFERACMRVYASSPLSLRVVLNVNTGMRVVHEVVPYPRDTTLVLGFPANIPNAGGPGFCRLAATSSATFSARRGRLSSAGGASS